MTSSSRSLGRRLTDRGRATVKRWAMRQQRPERNPVELFLCLAIAVFVGPIALGLRPLPTSLRETAPNLFGQVSAGLLVLGCVVFVAGACWRDRDTGILIQQAALWVVFSGLVIYGTVLGVSTGWSSNGAYAIACSYGAAAGFLVRIGTFQLWVVRRKILAGLS